MLPVQVLALRDLLNTYLEPQHVATVLRAYETGALAHEGQKRRSGEDYITHPVEVARILARLRMDHETIVAAILHDTIEDTELKRQDLVDQFGQEVADLEIGRASCRERVWIEGGAGGSREKASRRGGH